MIDHMDQIVAPHPRKVGWLLGLGILILPVVFAWFTLRDGYTKFIRMVSIIWMIFSVVVILTPADRSKLRTAQHADALKREKAVQLSEKTKNDNLEQSYLLQAQAESSVKARLRDADSAKFGNQIYELSTRTVCGTVNSKNGFGGYTGYTVFLYQNGAVTFPGELGTASGNFAVNACAQARGRAQLTKR